MSDLLMTADAWRGPPRGLSSEEALARQRQHGKNELARAKTASVWRKLAAQHFHFFALLLWGAGVLAAVAGMLSLALAIFAVIVLNGLFAFAQEHRADRAAERLQALLPRRAVVARDGALRDVAARELVPDDVVLLSAGDRIGADLRLVHGSALLVDTSTLSGESVPRSFASDAQVHAGCFVLEGEAFGVVTAIGNRTELARIAQLTSPRHRTATPLARELGRLVRIVALIALAVGVFFFAVGALMGLPLRLGFLFAIGVAVALVPEGLLPTVTLSLALGASRMARRGALVRRLEAVETLGSTTFVCTDKTGTLTRNEMNAVAVWTPSGGARVRGNGYLPDAEVEIDGGARGACRELALAAARCSTGRVTREPNGRWVARGDPMEAALHALALRLGVDVSGEERTRPMSRKFPFDPRRRRMSVVIGDRVFVKGALDALSVEGGVVEAAAAAAREMATRGLRVIAVASRRFDPSSIPQSVASAEGGLDLLGLVGLLDPPRPEARAALAACHRAGMRVAMVTGDHPATARAVAREVGLEQALVVSGHELPEDEALLGALLDRDGVIACRVSPEQKFAITKALQARGHVVAMTGDGVNDAPALRQADIGIAMGSSGTDVAREAADLVLLDDQFATIVHAIEQGRGTFANIRRSLTYHLTGNVAELTPFVLWALSGGTFPLALGVLQILCLDLLSDQLPALALGAELPAREVLATPPHRRHLVDAPLLMRAFGVLGITESVIEIAAFCTVLLLSGWRPQAGAPAPAVLAIASGAAFTAIIAGQSMTALACRSELRPIFRLKLGENRAVWIAILASWVVAALVLFVPAIAGLLGHAPPTAAGVMVALLALPLVIAVDAIHKRACRWRRAVNATSR